MLFLEQAFAYKEIQIAQLGYNYKKIDQNKFLTEKENAISESNDRMAKMQETFDKEQLEKTEKWYKEHPPLFMGYVEDKKNKKTEEEKLKESYQAFNEFGGTFADKLGLGDSFTFFAEMDENGQTHFQKLEDKGKATFLAISTAAQDSFNIIAEESNKRFEAEYKRLDEQKTIALGFAGDSASAKAKIEADYDKKHKEIANREAKAKQKQAIFNIAIDTAQAIMAVSAKAQWWMIPLMAALGATQIAVVASQKIPQYWRGTKNAPEGLALTNEKGAEIHTDSKGNIKDFGDNSGARLTKMSAGDIVYTAEESRRMMFENEYHGLLRNNGISGAKPNNGMTASEMEAVMVRTLGGRPTLNMNFDKGGFGTYISKNGNITRQSESRGSGRGIEI
jgi:hypothetical protein